MKTVRDDLTTYETNPRTTKGRNGGTERNTKGISRKIGNF